MNTTGIQYSTRRHRRLTLPGPEGAIFQPHPPAQLRRRRRRRRPRAWPWGGLAAPGAPGGTGPGAAAGCAAATAAAVALGPHPAAPSRRRGLPAPQPGGGSSRREEDREEAAGESAPPPPSPPAPRPPLSGGLPGDSGRSRLRSRAPFPTRAPPRAGRLGRARSGREEAHLGPPPPRVTPDAG